MPFLRNLRSGTVYYGILKFRSKSGYFLLPVDKQSFRNHHQRSCFIKFSGKTHRLQNGNNLQCLTEPHIVGDDGAYAQHGVVVKPAETAYLIRTQFCLNRGRHFDIPASEQSVKSSGGSIIKEHIYSGKTSGNGGQHQCIAGNSLFRLFLLLKEILNIISGKIKVPPLETNKFFGIVDKPGKIVR